MNFQVSRGIFLYECDDELSLIAVMMVEVEGLKTAVN
jgi:hypothetical protein